MDAPSRGERRPSSSLALRRRSQARIMQNEAPRREDLKHSATVAGEIMSRHAVADALQRQYSVAFCRVRVKMASLAGLRPG